MQNALVFSEKQQEIMNTITLVKAIKQKQDAENKVKQDLLNAEINAIRSRLIAVQNGILETLQLSQMIIDERKAEIQKNEQAFRDRINRVKEIVALERRLQQFDYKKSLQKSPLESARLSNPVPSQKPKASVLSRSIMPTGVGMSDEQEELDRLYMMSLDFQRGRTRY
jgi:hypothetical protein